MPGDQEIAAEIRRFIAEETLGGESDENEPLEDDHPLIESGMLDSFDLAALLAHLQDRFQVSISPAEMSPSDFETVRTICALVLRSRVEEAR